MFHYTDDSGFKGIGSHPEWVFRASKPPADNPAVAYFTTLPPATINLAVRLRIPKRKLEYLFSFDGDEGLEPIEGGRGDFIFWSKVAYHVEAGRQRYSGRTEEMP